MTTKKGESPENLLMIVGQLLEATKAASDGLKSLSLEVRNNASAIISAAKTLEFVEKTISELNAVVRANADSLVSQTAENAAAIEDLQTGKAELDKAVDELQQMVDTLGVDRVKADHSRDLVWKIIYGAAWAITTGIAVYAALGQWAAIKP